MRLGDLRERQHPVDHRLEPPARDVIEDLRKAKALGLAVPAATLTTDNRVKMADVSYWREADISFPPFYV